MLASSNGHPRLGGGGRLSIVGAARKVSRNYWIVWGQGNAPLVTSLPSSCYIVSSHLKNGYACRLA